MPLHAARLSIQVGLVGDFSIFPRVRKNGILWNLTPDEILERAGGDVDKMHAVDFLKNAKSVGAVVFC